MLGLSTPTHRRLIQALDAVKAAEGWTDRQLCAALDTAPTNLCQWRVGRSGIGERNLWKIRTFLSKYARRANADD